MENSHPFGWLTITGRKRTLILLVILTVGIIIGLQILGAPLKTDAAPAGIVSFEFAGTPTMAGEIINSWGERGRVYAGLSLGLDYLFLLAYAGTIGLACTLVAGSLPSSMASMALIGIILAWAQFGAAILDAIENYALIQVLLGSESALWSTMAKWCAIPKFMIVALGLLCSAFGLLLLRSSDRARKSPL